MSRSLPVRNPVRAVVPCRACLSGEDLDWLGGRSVSVALDLTTTVEVLPSGRADGPGSTGGWAREVWAYLRARLPGLPERAPAVRVGSDAPAASGLSSSTALIVALFEAYLAACGRSAEVDVETVSHWAYHFEFLVFNGGGMDQTAVIQGGALLLEGRTTGLPVIRERALFPEDWTVLVVDSATAKSTGDHIRIVRAQLADGDPKLADYMATADAASAEVWKALGARDLTALGDAMGRAHVAMRDYQAMSTPFLERLRHLAGDRVGLPLKLSGAGGGGALVGVCPADEAEATAARLRTAYEGHPDVRVMPVRAAGFRL
ncbi:mevalonate kinase [Streptomyces sp. NRRL WC-3742]|uniref:mevalonate kinase family protein n=1 Tax=Streptomyces sp. NRRL WC-3742 TaxID=1463934 RepID=UPI001F260761|nr:galactokinase [Streptomyces sp. NRRL WC-3742]